MPEVHSSRVLIEPGIYEHKPDVLLTSGIASGA
jgi:hypothetical protein